MLFLMFDIISSFCFQSLNLIKNFIVMALSSVVEVWPNGWTNFPKYHYRFIGFQPLLTRESPSLDLPWSEGEDWVTNTSDVTLSQHFHSVVNCCKLSCQLLKPNLQQTALSRCEEWTPASRVIRFRQFREVMFSPNYSLWFWSSFTSWKSLNA